MNLLHIIFYILPLPTTSAHYLLPNKMDSLLFDDDCIRRFAARDVHSTNCLSRDLDPPCFCGHIPMKLWHCFKSNFWIFDWLTDFILTIDFLKYNFLHFILSWQLQVFILCRNYQVNKARVGLLLGRLHIWIHWLKTLFLVVVKWSTCSPSTLTIQVSKPAEVYSFNSVKLFENNKNRPWSMTFFNPMWKTS